MGRIFRKFINAAEIIRTFKNWPILLLCYFGFFNIGLFNIGPYMVCTMRNGVKFKVRTSLPNLDDVGVILDTWVRETYHAISRKNIGDNNIVIDIGAQIGDFSVLAATVAKNVRVYAYEPYSESFSLLVDNIKLNGLENHIMPFDLSVVGVIGNGKRRLHITNSSATHSFYFSSGDKGVIVKCLTLEDIFDLNGIERCDFLKIDCEGAEYEILFNTPQECLSKIKKIHVEYHEFPEISYNRHDLIKVLTGAGFKVTEKSWHPHFGYIYGEKTLDSGKERRR